MRWVALAFILALALAVTSAEGYPLGGTNGIVDCIIFGAFKDPLTPGNANYGKNVILSIDLGIGMANSTEDQTVNPVYTLVDRNDRSYPSKSDYTTSLPPGRLIVGFVVPKEVILKELVVDPTADPALGERFSVRFPEPLNASNGNITLTYYGITESKVDSNKKTKILSFDIGVKNNGSRDLFVDFNNFSLKDQWGWNYQSQKYNRQKNEMFPKSVLRPNATLRSSLTFATLSPLSRPSLLVYNYTEGRSLIIDIDSEAGLRPSASGESEKEEEPDSGSTTLSGSIKASKARLAKVRDTL